MKKHTVFLTGMATLATALVFGTVLASCGDGAANGSPFENALTRTQTSLDAVLDAGNGLDLSKINSFLTKCAAAGYPTLTVSDEGKLPAIKTELLAVKGKDPIKTYLDGKKIATMEQLGAVVKTVVDAVKAGNDAGA
jgi:hypothetical protein